MFKKARSAVLLLSLMLATPSFAMTFSLEGAANFAKPSGDIGYVAKTGYGGGAALGFMLADGWGFDLGALYLQRKYAATLTVENIANVNVEQTQAGIEIPFILRYWMGHMLGFGLGGYYLKYLGNIKATSTPQGGVSTTTSTSYGDAGLSKIDYGLVASLRLDLPISFTSGLVLDGRYDLGLKNAAVSGGSTKFRDVTGIVGLRFGFPK